MVFHKELLGPLIVLLYVKDFSDKLESESGIVQFAGDIS